MTSRATAIVLIVIALGYAALGLVVSLRIFPIGDLDVEADFFAELGPAAQHIAAGEWLVANHPYKGPLEPALVALLHGALHQFDVGWYRCAVLVSLLGTALALLATGRLGFVFGGSHMALAAALLVAGCYLVFVQAHKASSDALFLGLVTATLAATLDREPVRARRWLLAGLLSGAAFLTRYIGAVLPVWVAGVAWWRPGAPSRARRPHEVGTIAAGFLVLAGPWFALNLVQTGSLLATRNRANITREYAGLGGTASAILHYLGNLPGHLALIAHHVVTWPSAIMAAVAIVILLVVRPAWRIAALMSWGLLYLAALALVFFVPRFGLPFVPVTALVTAWLLVGEAPPHAPAWLRRALAVRARAGHVAGWFVVAALVAAALPQSVAAVRFYRSQQPLHLRGTIAFLKRIDAQWPGGTRPVVMARKAHAAFHAGVDWRPYPARRLAARPFLQHAVARGVDFIVVGPIEREYADTAFDLGHLERLAGVTVAHTDESDIVYRLDRSVSSANLGVDARAQQARTALATAKTTNDPIAVVAAGDELALWLCRDGDYDAAESALRRAIAFADAQRRPDLDRIDRILTARTNLAWICLHTADHATGVAALADHLAAFPRQPDRILEAHACEYLGIHEAALGHTARARELWRRASDLYAETNREADRQRVLGLYNYK